MANLVLQRNVQFLYEEQLARTELDAMGCEHYERDVDNPWVFTAHVNGATRQIIERSAYVGSVDGEATNYSRMTQPKYQGGTFNRTRSVNQYLTHWIYPYRGKFHPQMVRALLNILGVQPGALVCEPYLGSGTTAVEASLLGIHVVAVDLSPLCVLLTRVKTQAYLHVADIRACVSELLAAPDVDLELAAAAESI